MLQRDVHGGLRGHLGERRRGGLAEGCVVAGNLGRVEAVEDFGAIKGGTDELVRGLVCQTRRVR